MKKPESADLTPPWQYAMADFLDAVEGGVFDHQQVVFAMRDACIELVTNRAVANFGDLQTYLRQRDSVVQLVARPFSHDQLPDPRLDCLDIVTHESREHVLGIAVGSSEIVEQMRALSLSDEVNETMLARDTGMLTFPE